MSSLVGGGAPSSPSGGAAASGGVENLTNQINKSSTYCLNEDARHPHTNLFIGDHTLDLRSDADEELLLHVSLMQTCKLSSLQISFHKDGSCPTQLKLFANTPNMAFSDAQEANPTQLVNVPINTESLNINLLAVKWSSVDSITIHVGSNHGCDYSAIHSLRLYGTPVMTMNVSGIKKC